ncbi:hypothetical protein PENTCL1PPCAC_20431 [Pristionchus entomophagus]|uniref:C6 domain-containing protein n=1 Tax=Pristionchus entomophagus TaxID=358040 RepID=A0AAV5TVJ2_9BILA|nr:hypothetical protein PENTCL1PPCAC_20431 [Pristionchus entomophagus]
MPMRTTLLVVSLVAYSSGCIPMTPTSPGIPAMPSVEPCKRCTFDKLMPKATAPAVWAAPSIVETGGCAVGTFTCLSGDISYPFKRPDGTTATGDNGGAPDSMLVLTCSSNSEWTITQGVVISVTCEP